MTDVVDHEARHKGDKAMDAIEAHERFYRERWNESRKASNVLVFGGTSLWAALYLVGQVAQMKGLVQWGEARATSVWDFFGTLGRIRAI